MAPLPHNLCAHLQNVTLARLASTSIPYTTMNLGIASILLRHGFISSVTRGPPLIKSTEPANPQKFHKLPVASKALHLTLKYRNSFPVIHSVRLFSKPHLPIHASSQEIRKLLEGSRLQKLRGIGMGEVVIVRTKDGRWLDGWEAVAEDVGGEVVMVVG
ncbi:Ribosomal protein S8 [Phaffia rhodozyma]|uniref:Ribosomal protein S8 n=1 Tax=Phaffia rhodozyma TaxID=264483 RepID=A0A0F7SVX9_PHARH|nr:Ribosomal protein S8 [Phaffia rhodozyma]